MIGWTAKVCIPDGEWIKYEDYAKLKAENERLRKAGDDLERDFYQQWYLDTHENLETFESNPSVKAWLAAKGVQS
jgi:hypothetical protein